MTDTLSKQRKAALLDDIEAALGKRLLTLTPKQFSQLTGSGAGRVREACARGEIPCAQPRGKYSSYRIPYTALAPYLNPS